MVGNRLEAQLALHLEHVADLVKDPREVTVGQVARRSLVIGAKVGVGGLEVRIVGIGGRLAIERNVGGRLGRRIGAGDTAGHGADGTRGGPGLTRRGCAGSYRLSVEVTIAR